MGNAEFLPWVARRNEDHEPRLFYPVPFVNGRLGLIVLSSLTVTWKKCLKVFKDEERIFTSNRVARICFLFHGLRPV